MEEGVVSNNIIELIQKCLALGKSPNENEASLAMSKAQELLEKYNLTLAQIEVDKSTKQELPNMVNIPIPLGRAEWKRSLIHYIAQGTFCKVVITGDKVVVLGRQANVFSTLVMASWIVAQLESIAWYETTTYSGNIPKLRFRDSFLNGAINRIDERLREERKTREVVNPNLKALVVNLSRETQLYTRTIFPHLGSHNSNKSFSNEAYQKGRAAGDKVSLTGSNQQLTNHKLLN